ncbi:sirohydrochlorin chelatase [Planctomicrobium sp. SH661]|uniref:sirohydrochlorin chelatase n=1 Tax=Planctomicrobium sp. SH661 TaxID=3448124 RepID=UPI003F5C1507
MSAAILLIAHGSRRAEANADLVQLAELLGPRVSDQIVEIAYLELAEPTIPEGLRTCVNRGATSIRMLPYFLSAGAHVTDDLKEFRADFIAANPGIHCRICPPLGLHPLIVEVLLDRLKQ